jgi:hypothetical protein
VKQADQIEDIFQWMNELEPTTLVDNSFRETRA